MRTLAPRCAITVNFLNGNFTCEWLPHVAISALKLLNSAFICVHVYAPEFTLRAEYSKLSTAVNCYLLHFHNAQFYYWVQATCSLLHFLAVSRRQTVPQVLEFLYYYIFLYFY